MLNTHRVSGFVTSRGYRQCKACGSSARRLRDAVLVEHIREVHAGNYGVHGVRKMWHALRRSGIQIGLAQTARLMRLVGVQGKGKGRSPLPTRKDKREDARPDLIHRELRTAGPNRLCVWGADNTYVRTAKGCVCCVRDGRVFTQERGMGTIRYDEGRGIAVTGTELSDRKRKRKRLS